MEKREAKILRRFLLKGTYPDAYSKNEKRGLRVKAESFTCVDRVLYHVRKGKDEQRVVIGKEKDEILEALHQGAGGAHFGVNSTMVKIAERYWWKGMSADVMDFCKHCEACQRANPLSKPPPSRLHPIKVNNELFNRWGIDLVGTLSFYKDGKSLGVAFDNLQDARSPLYPWIASTAARSELQLGRRFRSSVCPLFHLCLSNIAQSLHAAAAAQLLPLPQPIKDRITALVADECHAE